MASTLHTINDSRPRRACLPTKHDLEAQAARAGQGDYAALAQPVSGIGEIQTLHATLAQMAEQLRSYQRSLQSYAGDVIRGQEDERSRLAHELHDETVQALIALDQQLQLIERTARRDPQAALAKLTELRAMTAITIADVRRVIGDLRPIYLEDLGLVPAIEMLTSNSHFEFCRVTSLAAWAPTPAKPAACSLASLGVLRK